MRDVFLAHFLLNSLVYFTSEQKLHQHCFTSEVLSLTAVMIFSEMLTYTRTVCLTSFSHEFKALFPHNATSGPDRRKRRTEHFKVLKARLKGTETLMFTLAIRAVSPEVGVYMPKKSDSFPIGKSHSDVNTV